MESSVLQTAIQRVYMDNPGPILQVIKQFRFSTQESEDIFQNVFEAAWTRIDTLKDPSKIIPWIRSIARNQCLNRKRTDKRWVPVGDLETHEWGGAIPDGALAPSMDEMKATMDFEIAIDKLKILIDHHQCATRREIAKCFYVQHLTIREISEKFDMKTNTVLSHLRRFRLIISKAMLAMAEEEGLEWEVVR